MLDSSSSRLMLSILLVLYQLYIINSNVWWPYWIQGRKGSSLPALWLASGTEPSGRTILCKSRFDWSKCTRYTWTERTVACWGISARCTHSLADQCWGCLAGMWWLQHKANSLSELARETWVCGTLHAHERKKGLGNVCIKERERESVCVCACTLCVCVCVCACVRACARLLIWELLWKLALPIWCICVLEVIFVVKRKKIRSSDSLRAYHLGRTNNSPQARWPAFVHADTVGVHMSWYHRRLRREKQWHVVHGVVLRDHPLGTLVPLKLHPPLGWVVGGGLVVTDGHKMVKLIKRAH